MAKATTTTGPAVGAATAVTAVTGVTVEAASLPAVGAAADQLAAMSAQYAADRDLVNQILGQVQATQAIAKLTATVAVSKMAYIKERKLYQALSGMVDRDGRGLTGTWEDFCTLLGTSAPKVNEDIANLQAFGEEALESMGRMGIGYRELRQYRRLPADERATLLEAARSGDPARFEEVAEEILAKTQKVQAEKEKRISELEADYKARGEALEEGAKERTQLKEQLHRAQHPAGHEAAAAAAAQHEAVVKALHQATLELMVATNKWAVAIADTAHVVSQPVETLRNESVRACFQHIAAVAAEWGIEVDFETEVNPPWLQSMRCEAERVGATGADGAE